LFNAIVLAQRFFRLWVFFFLKIVKITQIIAYLNVKERRYMRNKKICTITMDEQTYNDFNEKIRVIGGKRSSVIERLVMLYLQDENIVKKVK